MHFLTRIPKRFTKGFFFITLALWSNGLLAQQNAADTITQIEPAKYWATGASFGLNFSQVTLSNWAGGGQSSISIGSMLNLSADYNKGKSIWESRLDVVYGLIRQGDQEIDHFRKTDDMLNLASRYFYHIEEGFYFSGLLDFRTQMGVGYDYEEQNGELVRTRISDFMAPGFLLTSLGITYKKAKHYTIKISPVTGKYTFVLDDSLANNGAFGVTPGQHARAEFGALFNASYEKEIFTNTSLRSNLNLFSNYNTLTRMDVNWEGILVLKVNKYINSTIGAQLIYDHDVIERVQWRNSINVGFLMTL